MQTILSLSGVRVHVGFYRNGKNWLLDEADCYVVNKRDAHIAQIDDIDTLGIMRNGVFHSVRTLAEKWIDGRSSQIAMDEKRSVIEARRED